MVLWLPQPADKPAQAHPAERCCFPAGAAASCHPATCRVLCEPCTLWHQRAHCRTCRLQTPVWGVFNFETPHRQHLNQDRQSPPVTQASSTCIIDPGSIGASGERRGAPSNSVPAANATPMCCCLPPPVATQVCVFRTSFDVSSLKELKCCARRVKHVAARSSPPCGRGHCGGKDARYGHGAGHPHRPG